MLVVRPSRTGAPTALCNGVSLHSPYDPEREAERFVAAGVGRDAPGTIVVLGEGIGHITRAARTLYPGARVLSLHYATELWAHAPPAAHAAWHPGTPGSALEFLRRALAELDVEGLRVIEWPPSRSLFPEVSRCVLEAVAQTVRELNGALVTTASSGRRWLRNSVLNTLLGPDPLCVLPYRPGTPIVVAASGPSLERAADAIRPIRQSVSLWALPSAVEHLLAVDLEPDLVVVTDAVYYSVYHLHRAAGKDLAVAYPPSAATGLWRVSTRAAYLEQPTFYERALLGIYGGGAAAVRPHGTVAGTAIELALGACAPHHAPVVIAGLDLCVRDIRSHCRPNAFERLAPDGRIEPLHHRLASSVWDTTRPLGGSDARVSPPLSTYAGWFAAAPSPWAGRLRRLYPSPVSLPTMPEITAHELEQLAGPHAPQEPGAGARRIVPPEERLRGVLGLLDAWQTEVCACRNSPETASHAATAIARLLGTAQLVEVRKLTRHGDTKGGRSAWAELMDTTSAYLAGLRELVVAHA